MSFRDFVERLLSKSREEDDFLSDFSEKRQFNRIELEEREQLFLNLLQPDSNEVGHTVKAHVSNVSLRGARLHFDHQEDVSRLQAHEQLTCSLSVDGFPIPLHVEVVRVVGPMDVAVAFRAPYPRELERLERFIEPRCLGMSLREIRQDALQGGPVKGLRWFQGINNTDFFSWADTTTGEIIQQQLVFLDKVVEWKKDQPLKTGKVQEQSSAQGTLGWVKSDLLTFDSQADQDLLTKTKQLLGAAAIDPLIKEIFLNKIKD